MSKPAAWYSIRKHAAITAAVLATAAAAGAQPPKSSAEILIYGDIGESWWDETTSARDFVRDAPQFESCFGIKTSLPHTIEMCD